MSAQPKASPRAEWKPKSAKELLELKICDMACGSGAFLVQAARYMSERLLEAWDAAKQANPNTPGITPEGTASTGKANETLIPDDPAERKTYAMRIIAQRCLYGVDKNPLAAEMAKLSLWLLTLAKDKPFEFLDHSIRCGDSLVGLHDLEQLRHFSLKPDSDDAVLFKGPLDEAVDEAINLRLKLEDLPSNTVEDVERQDKLLREANDKMARLRCAADLLVAAEFWGGNAKDKLERGRHAAVTSSHYVEKGPTEEFEQVAVKERRGQIMFHWPLEFPEVIIKRGGFHAFVGNPPFMGGRLLGRAFSKEFHDFLVLLRNEIQGSPDLCTYFFLRAHQLLGQSGGFGLLATKSIAETGSRIVCLDRLLSEGITFPRALSRCTWPGTASVVVSVVHGIKGSWLGPFVLDNREVSGIDGGLTEPFSSLEPHKLKEMHRRFSQGQDLMGLGFELDEQQRQQLLTEDPSCQEVIHPLFKGDDIANRPDLTPYRWAIYFRRMDEQAARSYGPAFRHVEMYVKPFRETLTGQIHEKCFWKFWDYRPKLVEEMESHHTMLASPRVSKYISFRVVSTTNIYNEKTKLYFFYDWRDFAVLQSSLHREWTYHRCGTLGTTAVNYSTTAALEPWPMPRWADCSTEVLAKADSTGREYHGWRDGIAKKCQQGLTSIYNRFHDPDDTSFDIQKLRELHVEMDHAVAAAYDWSDLDLGHDFHETKQGLRYTVNEPARRDVLQRLFKLNFQRYETEVKQGLHTKGNVGTRRTATTRQANSTRASSDDRFLFDNEDD